MEARSNLRGGLGRIIRYPWFWPVAIAVILGAGFALTSLGQLERATGTSQAVGLTKMAAPGLFSYDVEQERAGAGPMMAAPSPVAPLAVDRKVIATATLEIRVKSAGQAADDLARLAVAAGGFVQSSGTATMEDGGHTANLVLRIPQDRFENFLATAGGLGKLLRKEQSGQDVTEDYLDLDARLRNWRNEEQQLNLIMTRAKTVGEVLSVQEKLGEVREKIEQIQGRLKYYDYNIALSTVNVSLYEGNRPASTPWIVEELSALGRALFGSIRGLLQVVLVLMPWIMAGWGLWAIGKRTFLKPRA